jgi:hypothetical protein
MAGEYQRRGGIPVGRGVYRDDGLVGVGRGPKSLAERLGRYPQAIVCTPSSADRTLPAAARQTSRGGLVAPRTEPNYLPVPARQVIGPDPVVPSPAPQRQASTLIPPVPEELRGIHQAIHRASAPRRPQPRGASPPLPTTYRTIRNLAADQDPPQNPHSTYTSPAPHAKPTVTHFRWSEAGFASSRDRTRTYNLPVNSRLLCQLSYAGSTRIRVAHSERACDARRVSHLSFTSRSSR